MTITRALRIAFMGTPDFSVSALEALIASPHKVVCIYSQPSRPKGRGNKVQESPVHVRAIEAGIEVRTPLNFKNPDDIAAFKALDLDVAVVAAYGLILPQAVLDAPRFGCINIHASLLPRWRGAAPMQRAIWAGDSETGVTLMQMDAGLDTGAMIAMERTPITPLTTLPQLHDALAQIGADMVVPYLNKLAANEKLAVTSQPIEGMTYAKMLTKNEGHINWAQNVIEIDRQIRALNPWPGTWTLDEGGKRLKILAAQIADDKTSEKSGTLLAGGKIACGDGSVLALQSLQPENKKPMDAQSALNDGVVKVGERLT